MATLLITGGCGYIGSHAVKHFLKAGFRVIVFDNLSHGYEDVVAILKKYGTLEFIQGDLCNKKDIERAFEQAGTIDAVFHFAALCSVDESTKQPELYFKNNVLGTQNLLNAMEKHEVQKIIFSSTCAVYGNAKFVPVDECHSTNPTNPYGESKIQAEKVIEDFSKNHDLRYVILRYFNVCGADTEGEIGDNKKPSLLLVQNAVRGALSIEPFSLTCPWVDTPDGTPIRDYIDVVDLVDAHMRAFQYLKKGGASTVINLGSGRGWSVHEILKIVQQELGTEFKVTTSADLRQGEYPAMIADIQKAEETLGWKPVATLSESIKSLKMWYEKNPYGYHH